MTSSTSGREPGRVLLALARVLFDEATRSSIVHPAIADVQHEWREAGPNRLRRWTARCHGMWAFCKLLAILSVEGMHGGVRGARLPASGEFDGPTLAILATAFFASAWGVPMFGWFTALALSGGFVLAAGMRWWRTRRQRLTDDHPVLQPWPRIERDSSMPAGGAAGVLMTFVGSVAVLLQGMPSFVWFFLGACGIGLLLAYGLWISRTRSSGATH